MEYRTLGRSGIVVSEISLGCWAIGGPSWRDGNPVGWTGNNDEDSLAGLHRAFELGITHFDTADVYGDGHSERMLGKFLKDVPRDKIVIATKVGWFRGTAANAMEPLHIRHQLEQSLVNLGTDYIDIHFFHNTNFGDNDINLEPASEMMRQLKQEGKLRTIGQSGYGYQDILRASAVTKPDVLQFHYNAFGNSFDKPGTNLFEWADSQDLGMVLFGPVAQGILLDKFDPENPPQFGDGDIRKGNSGFTKEKLLEMRERLQPLKQRFGGSVDELVRVALQFALAQSKNATVIPGFKNIRQVESNASAAGKPLSTSDVAFVIETLR